MDSIPSSNSTNWIHLSNNGKNTIQEFLFDKPIHKFDFKLQFNCSNSCWRSMVTANEVIVLAVRCYNDNKLVNQVSLLVIPIMSLPNHNIKFSAKTTDQGCW